MSRCWGFFSTMLGYETRDTAERDPFDIDTIRDDEFDRPQFVCRYNDITRSADYQRIRCSTSSYPCTIYGHPSTGGIVMLFKATLVDLNWLELPRFQNSYRSDDPQVEDEFCLRLIHLGARWWKSEEFHEERLTTATEGFIVPGDHIKAQYARFWPPELHIGFPYSHGVWVLSFAYKNWDAIPKGFHRLYLTTTMNEKCDVLESLGATFYHSLADCPDIFASLADAIVEGEEVCSKIRTMKTTLYKERMRAAHRVRNALDAIAS